MGEVRTRADERARIDEPDGSPEPSGIVSRPLLSLDGEPDGRGPSRGRGHGARRAVRAMVVGLLVLGMVGLGSLGLLKRIPEDSAPSPRPPAGPAPAPPPVLPGASLQQIIASLQSRLRSVPTDWDAFAQLGLAYVQEARVTADPTYYPKAEGVLQRSLRLHPGGNVDASIGMAALAAARHDFSGALAWGQRAVATDPYSAQAYAVVGDAQVELGWYEQAFATFQTMIDLKPELSTYARVSYAWELQGSYPNALKAMNLALGAAGTPEDAAWVENQLGELYFNSGRLSRAEAAYQQAILRDPSFVPPHAGQAKAEAAGGLLDQAIQDYEWVVARFPLPEYVIALGDLYHVTGQEVEAQRQYALVHAEEELFRANGVNVDLEVALFDADHGVDLAAGLAAAQAEWARRQSVNVADALAWQLYANGRFEEALTLSNQALRLGTRYALFYFHRGMIERALGRDRAARRDLATALDINPRFSILWARTAADALAAMGGKP